MKFKVIVIVFLFLSLVSFGQKYAVHMDSLTTIYLNKLSQKEKKQFQRIVETRTKFNLYKRIDSVNFDYLFITETYCKAKKNRSTAIERYYLKSDTISNLIKVNGIKSKGFEYCMSFLPCFKLDTLIHSYQALVSYQVLNYGKEQIMIIGCVRVENDDQNFIKHRKNQLAKTIQIQTMIDKVENIVIVSIQHRPCDVNFELVYYNPLSHCW